MKRLPFLAMLFAAAFVVALLQMVMLDGEVVSAGSVAAAVGAALFYWLLSAIPVGFQRHGVKVWPSALILLIVVALSTLGRLSV